MLRFIYLLIAVGCGLAVFRWRWGVLAAIVIGFVQDPLRKMVPGTPGILAMASVPVWLTVLGSAFFVNQLKVRAFLNQFPRLGTSVVWFAGYLILPASLSATYGANTWMITILGAVIYISSFLALTAGWCFARTETEVTGLLRFYAVCAAVMLIGGPLDRLGLSARCAAIGTEAMGHVWLTQRTGAMVPMLAGFFRGPDLMGWHAALLFMISIILAFRTRGAARLAWIGFAVWAILNLWLCGRRKMLSMTVVFVGAYVFLIFQYKNVRRFLPMLGILVMTLGIAWYGISSLYRSEAVEDFYLTAFHEAGEQFARHGYSAVFTTIRQAGFLGYGLGMGQQGLQHIQAEKPRLWQESGPSKLAAELGVPGSLLFLWLLAMLLMTAFHVVRYSAGRDSFYVMAGLFAVLAANLTSATISAQVFGDPFIAIWLALLTGLLLSGTRLARESGRRSAHDDQFGT